MYAIMNGKKGKTSRGDSGPPKSVAAKYSGADKDAPESKGKELKGGRWGSKGDSSKNKKKLKKALIAFMEPTKRKGAGCIVINEEGYVLLGNRADTGMLSTVGGTVDPGENYKAAAIRELKEESGLKAKEIEKCHEGVYGNWCNQTFVVTKYSGTIMPNGEMNNLKFYPFVDIPWHNLTDYARDSLHCYINKKLKKSTNIKDMITCEDLKKNLMAGMGSSSDIVFNAPHHDCLSLVGNGVFRMIRDAVLDLEPEHFRDFHVDTYNVSVRKHVDGTYSGRISDGLKQVHQFTNKNIPSLATDLMSLFEWYLPEDEAELELLDDHHLTDDIIHSGLEELVNNYKKHQVANVYTEMETIREEMRQGHAVDLQQAEKKIMQLFDKLEASIIETADKHNNFCLLYTSPSPRD